MAAPKAPLLDSTGKKAKDVTLAAEVFAVDVKPHLIHETVRAESAADRSGTQSAKSRGLVAGGRAKPWRQKGTGPQPRSYALKVNRKARRSALRGALSAHAQRGSLGVIDGSGFEKPSTRDAANLLGTWGNELPVVLVAQPEEETVAKSFRNLDRVLVLEPSELEVGALVWANSVLATEAALDRIKELAS
jgi:large subunit ribosomal protein L4